MLGNISERGVWRELESHVFNKLILLSEDLVQLPRTVTVSLLIEGALLIEAVIVVDVVKVGVDMMTSVVAVLAMVVLLVVQLLLRFGPREDDIDVTVVVFVVDDDDTVGVLLMF